MKKEPLSKKELEHLCVKEGIILERSDIISNTTFFLPNLEKIGIMIREFGFLVDGASRGKAINEISKIELYLYEHENQPDLQNNLLATKYSNASIFLESKKDLIADKNSENWKSIFLQYFSLEDIYGYFHKTEGASNFFRKFGIYDEIVELNYYIKLMEYLQSQIELTIPFDEDRIIPYKIDSLELVLLIFEKTGFLNSLKKKMKDNYFVDGAKLINTILGKPPSNWKKINTILRDLENNEMENILTDSSLADKFREILFHYKIDLR